MPETPTGFLDLEVLRGKRILLIVSGAISAAFTPYWINWIRALDLELETRVVLTKTAQKFVAPTALSALLGRPTETDSWWKPGQDILHVDLADWADGIVVHPCTFDYLSRIATGRGDSPSMLALQSTQAATVICPALPPGAINGHAYQQHTLTIDARNNATVLPPGVGRSAKTGRYDAAPPVHFPIAMGELARLMRQTTESTRQREKRES